MDVFEELNSRIERDDVKGVERYIKENSLSHAMYVEVCRKFVREQGSFEFMFFNCESVLPKEYPTITAAKCGRLDIFKTLVKLGFDCNMVSMLNIKNDERGPGPIHYACREGHLAVVKYLVEELGVSVRSKSVMQPHCCVIERKHVQVVRYMVTQGTPPNRIDLVWSETTPLHLAVLANSEEIVSFLVHEGADINASKAFRNKTLACAVRRKSIKIIQTLVEARALMEGPEEYVISFVAAAAEKGRLDVLKYICSSDADEKRFMNISAKKVFIKAVRDGNYEVVRYVVVELNMQAKRARGLAALDEAVGRYFPSIVCLLVDCEVRCRHPGFQFRFLDNVSDDKRCYILDLFNRRVENPPALSQLCCFRIRRTLGRNLLKVVDSLPLPQKMIDFVKLNHIPLTPDGYQVRCSETKSW